MSDETKQPYDFTTPVEKTSVKLAKSIAGLIVKYQDDIILTHEEQTNPENMHFAESATDFAIDVMKEIAQSDIPHPYADKGIDKIIQILESLRAYVKGMTRQQLDEIMSRTLGVRNPENNKYTEDLSTLGNIALTLDTIRKSQGNNLEDYFTFSTAEDKKMVEDHIAETQV